MKIQANKNPLPPVESFTVTLTPREAVLLAALIGHTTREDREKIINSRLDRCADGLVGGGMVPNELNVRCSVGESRALEPLYFELTRF